MFFCFFLVCTISPFISTQDARFLRYLFSYLYSSFVLVSYPWFYNIPVSIFSKNWFFLSKYLSFLLFYRSFNSTFLFSYIFLYLFTLLSRSCHFLGLVIPLFCFLFLSLCFPFPITSFLSPVFFSVPLSLLSFPDHVISLSWFLLSSSLYFPFPNHAISPAL